MADATANHKSMPILKKNLSVFLQILTLFLQTVKAITHELALYVKFTVSNSADERDLCHTK